MKRNILILSLILITTSCYGYVGQVWDVFTDFSASNNPNGQWSYHEGYSNYPSGGALLAPGPSGLWLCGAPTWARFDTANNNFPGDGLLNNSQCLPDVEPNDFLHFGPLAIKWTAFESGVININGSLQQHDHPLDRQLTYTLAKNGTIVDAGEVSTIGLAGRVYFNNGNDIVLDVYEGDSVVLTIDGYGSQACCSPTYGYATFTIKQTAVSPPPGPGFTWDAKGGSSTTFNPIGPWSYRNSAGNLLINDGLGNLCGTGNVWNDSNGTPPHINFVDTCLQGAETDDFMMYGPGIVRWTSPIDGVVKIKGALKYIDYPAEGFDPERHPAFTITHNLDTVAFGETLTSGGAPLKGAASKIEFDHLNPNNLTVTLKKNDTIYLLIDGSGSLGDGSPVYTYSDFQIIVVSNDTCYVSLLGDIDNNCKVNAADLMIIADNWLINCDAIPQDPACTP